MNSMLPEGFRVRSWEAVNPSFRWEVIDNVVISDRSASASLGAQSAAPAPDRIPAESGVPARARAALGGGDDA